MSKTGNQKYDDQHQDQHHLAHRQAHLLETDECVALAAGLVTPGVVMAYRRPHHLPKPPLKRVSTWPRAPAK